MLTRLRLRNFKSWPDTRDIDLAPITGFFGANSSGKTSLLQALLLMKQTAEANDRGLVFDYGDDRTPVNLGDFESVIHGHREDAELKLALDWRAAKPFSVIDTVGGKRKKVQEDRRLGFSLSVDRAGEGRSRRVAVREMAYRVGGEGGARFGMRREGERGRYKLFAEGSDFEFKRSVGRPSPLPPPVKSYGFPDEVRAHFQNAGFLADLALALEERMRDVYYLGPLRAFPERQYTWTGAQPTDVGGAGEAVFAALLASKERGETISLGQGRKRRSLEEHVASWLRKLGLIDSFEVKKLSAGRPFYEVWVRKTPESAPVLITDVGFGVSQILPCLVLLFYVPRGSTVILEQPEIHLHPAVQAGLGDVLIEAHQMRGVQILLESHSEHLLRRIQRRVAEGAVKKDDIGLFFCEIGAAGSERTPLDLDSAGNVANWPEDFFGDTFGEITAMSVAALQRRGVQIEFLCPEQMGDG